jgi:prepilin-type N-terminal cleavage/methylation domain-containing protein
MGFTLTEMLAVMGIALVLMAATVGVLVAVAGHIGPEHAAMTLQSALNGTRAYAASKGLPARLVVESSLQKTDRGSIMTIEYREPTAGWVRVPNMEPVHLGAGMFALKSLPSGMASLRAPALPINPQAPTASERDAWNQYSADVFGAVASHAVGGGATAQGLITANEFSGAHTTFYVYFDPAGYLALSGSPYIQGSNTEALTLIQLTGRRLTEYLFYPLNRNTGTRLVFE